MDGISGGGGGGGSGDKGGGGNGGGCGGGNGGGGRWNKYKLKGALHRGGSNGASNEEHDRGRVQQHETPSQLTLATQDTSIGSTTTTTTTASRAQTPLLLPRRRQRPPQQLQVLDDQRLADIAAHDETRNVEDDDTSFEQRQVARASQQRQRQRQHQHQHQHQTAISATEERLRWRQRQVVVLAAGSLGTLAGFVVVVLPTPALLLLVAWMALTAATIAAARQYLVSWWNQQLVRHGLGPYLPDALYRLLTHESIHSFMTDDTFMLENRHLLLYFLPLPPPALERYVQRLAPRHVQRLHRPGLGHLLGEAAMRIIVGQERYERQFQRPGVAFDADLASDGTPATAATAAGSSSTLTPSSVSRRALPQPPPTQRPTLEVIIERPSSHQDFIPMVSSRRRLDLEDDDDGDNSSDLGLDVSADDVIEGAITDDQARRMASALPLPATRSWVDSESEQVTPQAPVARRLLDSAMAFSEVTSSPAQSALTTPGAPRPRGADPDNDEKGDDLPSAAGAATTSDDVLSLAEEYADEELVLTQAVINAMYDGVWTPLSRYFVSAAEETAGPMTARFVTYGLGVSAVSTVLGLFLGMVGYRRGIYRRPTIAQAYPRENTLYTTIMLGIAGTGVTLLAHWHLNRGKKKGRSYFYSQFSRRPSRKGS